MSTHRWCKGAIFVLALGFAPFLAFGLALSAAAGVQHGQ